MSNAVWTVTTDSVQVVLDYLAQRRSLSRRRRKSLRVALLSGDLEQINQEAYAILNGIEMEMLLHPRLAQREVTESIEERCRIEGGEVAPIRGALVCLMEYKGLDTGQITAITSMEVAA